MTSQNSSKLSSSLVRRKTVAKPQNQYGSLIPDNFTFRTPTLIITNRLLNMPENSNADSVYPETPSEWVFGFNDPTIFGWLIVCLYALGAYRCWRSKQPSPSLPDQQSTWLWRYLSFALVAFGINKQLDLHYFLLLLLKRSPSNAYEYALYGISIGLGLLLLAFLTFNLGRTLVVHASREMLWSYCILSSLLALQFFRFLPGPTSKILGFHPFTADGLLHVHVIEFFEITVLLMISYWANRQTEPVPARKLEPDQL